MSRPTLFLGFVFVTGCPEGRSLIEDLGAIEQEAGIGALDQGPRQDMSAEVGIESCETACDRYAACGRSNHFGDNRGCLEYCARVTRGGRRPDIWWDCVEAEPCRLLRRCPTPELESLPCDEICARARRCRGDPPDCERACGIAGEAFVRCGDALLDDCSLGEFVTCLGHDVYPACGLTCREGARCNALPEAGCLFDCLAAVGDADPLFSVRATQRNACIERAEGRCAQIDRCVEPPGPEDGAVVTPQQLCARWDRCGLDDLFRMPCQEMLQQIGQDLAALACVFAHIDPSCAEDPFLIFQVCFNEAWWPNPRWEICTRLCEAKQACGMLEDHPLALPDCRDQCTGHPGTAPGEGARATLVLPCVAAERCPIFEQCLREIGSVAECRAHCTRLAECGMATPGCQAQCDLAWPRSRHTAYRECVLEADGCQAVGACELASSGACGAYCDRLRECAGGLHCEQWCDDQNFADPVGHRLLEACVISAPACRDERDDVGSVSECTRDPAGGLGCLGFCRAITECSDVGDLGECLVACRSGFSGDDAQRLAGALGCLRGLPPDASCPALGACLPDGLDMN